MANAFYDPGEGRAAKVQDLFAAIAPRYDLINDLQSFGLHRCWKRRVVALACPRPGERALDLCCGTGDLSLALARQGARVVGLDFSAQMLAVAEARKSKVRVPETKDAEAGTQHRQRSSSERNQTAPVSAPPGLGPSAPVGHGSLSPLPLALVRGDAQRLPFPDNSFDLATIGYGLRNLASWEGGLREMQRVAKPGGRLVVLDFGKPDNAVWRALYFGYLRFFVPWLGRIFCGNAGAYGYIIESLKHYPAQRGVAAKMTELGLARVRIVQLLGGVMSINYGEKVA